MNKKWIGRLTCLLLATLVLYILAVYVLVPNCYTAFGDYELGPGDTQASWGGYFLYLDCPFDDSDGLMKLRCSQEDYQLISSLGKAYYHISYTDFFGGSGCVAGYNLDLDAGINHLAHSIRHISAHRVRDCHNTEECQIFGYDLVVFDCLVAVTEFLICETESSHSLILISEELGIDFLFGHSGGVLTHTEDDFGSTFDIEDCLACSGLDDSSHILALGRERKFLNALSLVLNIEIVDTSFMKPKEKCSLGGVAEHLSFVA